MSLVPPKRLFHVPSMKTVMKTLPLRPINAIVHVFFKKSSRPRSVYTITFPSIDGSNSVHIFVVFLLHVSMVSSKKNFVVF